MTQPEREPTAAEPDGPTSEPAAPLAPARVDTFPIIVAGTVCWLVALVVTLLVPSWHTGDRDWWPWACVTGLVLGGIGLIYVRRGRGNASGARRGE